MENIDSIKNYQALVKLAKGTDKILLVTLQSDGYQSLMCQVISSAVEDFGNKIQCLSVQGKAAKVIQRELNILNLPALVIFKEGRITSIFQGLIAHHELQQILAKIN